MFGRRSGCAPAAHSWMTCSFSVGEASIAAPQCDTAPSGGNNALRRARWASSRPGGTHGANVEPEASTLAGATWKSFGAVRGYENLRRHVGRPSESLRLVKSRDVV